VCGWGVGGVGGARAALLVEEEEEEEEERGGRTWTQDSICQRRRGRR